MPPNVGMPIGNITSQLLANFYLSYFDGFMLEECAYVGAGYVRFVDDAVVVCHDKQFILDLRKKAAMWLKKHLRLTLSRGESAVYALRFSTTLAEFPYEVGDTVDLAVTLDVNVYNHSESLSIVIRDIRFSGREEDDLLRSKALFESFCRGDDISPEQARSLIPTREEFAVVYRFLRSSGGYRYPFDCLLHRLNSTISYGKLRVIMECMNELGLITIDEGMYEFEIKLCEVSRKVDLNTSVIITKLREVSACE